MPSSPLPFSLCPLCKAKGSLFQKSTRSIYGQHFDIHKCSSCSVCYTFPSPSADLLTRIYSGEYWLRSTKENAPKAMTGIVQRFNRVRLAAMVQPLTQRLKSGDKILEVGVDQDNWQATCNSTVLMLR